MPGIKLCICFLLLPAASIIAQKEDEIFPDGNASEMTISEKTRKVTDTGEKKNISLKKDFIERSFREKELLQIEVHKSKNEIDITGSLNKVVSFAGFYDGKIDLSHNSSLHLKPLHELEIYSISHRHSVIPISELQSHSLTFALETITLGAVETACSFLFSRNNIVTQSVSFIINNGLKLIMDALSNENEEYSFYYVWVGVRF